MLVAIGSTRAPKVLAVEHIFAVCAQRLGTAAAALEFFPCEVESGISAMPLTQEELMTGARQRAVNAETACRRKGRAAEYAIGLEGGFSENPAVPHSFFLQAWVFIKRGDDGYFGGSPAIPVPAVVAREVVLGKEELGVVIDRFAGRDGVRDRGGAFEIFTAGYLTRQGIFETALMCALAPFYNARLYA